MKKVLFLGDLNTYSRSFQRYCVFSELIKHVDSISLVPVGCIPGLGSQPSILYKIMYKLGYPLDEANANKKLMNYVEQKCPDLIWIEKGLSLYPQTIRYIKRKCPNACVILYSNDNMGKKHNRSRFLDSYIKELDVIFTVWGYSADYLYKLGARHVEYFHRAYDKNYISPRSDNEQYLYDVIFIGTYEKARCDAITYLASQGIAVTIFGNGWSKIPSSTPENTLSIQQKPLYGKEFVSTMHKSKIVLNFVRHLNDDVTTGRTFEIPASGSFMLAEYTPEQEQYFLEGKEAEFFRDNQDLVEKARYYLNHCNQRARIAKAGLRRCIKSGYSYHERLAQILQSIM